MSEEVIREALKELKELNKIKLNENTPGIFSRWPTFATASTFGTTTVPFEVKFKGYIVTGKVTFTGNVLIEGNYYGDPSDPEDYDENITSAYWEYIDEVTVDSIDRIIDPDGNEVSRNSDLFKSFVESAQDTESYSVNDAHKSLFWVIGDYLDDTYVNEQVEGDIWDDLDWEWDVEDDRD